ncbi:hypothetical protein K458DRAFT_405738 [Lentithecium fluviatile CBS 122367]|uniref:DUF6594 domain-containing protein n=1 Tax=Lentithecium fluviatile CBS 122367 TaxID=1168545 RepID=A0A6G1IW43_9PLEO|nr:hypothetical protein K458DRAFT_405738 [Lentithecium fluviatile CBS 122367]
MAVPQATAASQIPGSESQALPVRDLMKSLVAHEDLFKSIAEHPQAGVFRRHTEEWALCLFYLESEVSRRYRDVKKFCQAEGRGKGSGESEVALRNSLADKMISLFKGLKMHSQAVHWAREMAQAATPSILFADFFRAHFKAAGGSARAPNGEDTSVYGNEGTPMSDEFQAQVEAILNPIEWLLVNKMMNPFIDFFCRPFRKAARKIKRGGDSNVVVDQMVVNFAVISAIARVVLCMLANGCLAAAIGALNSVDGWTTKIIVMTVIGLVFASLVSFLGHDSIPIWTLITAYVQAMVFFVGTTSDQRLLK